MKKSNKNKGFTLIEILATILIISIVFGASYYFIMNTINNSKEKSKEISINSIKTSARTYSKEYPNNLIWKEDGENHYACVTIQDLINAGYYKEEQLPKELNGKSIILTKNSSNTIINEELDESGGCELPSNQYMIKFRGNGSSSVSMTDLKCTRDMDCTLSENQYKRTGYKFMGWSPTASGGAVYKDKEVVKNLTSSGIIELYAVWNINKVYIRYHAEGGTITPQTTDTNGTKNKWSITENGIILKNNKGYHNVNYGTNLNKGLDNYNDNNLIKIIKKGYIGQEGKEWCTSPNGGGTCYNQATPLTNVGTGTGTNQLCNASNDDCTINLYLNWRKNRVIIKYNSNGGNVTPRTSNVNWSTNTNGIIKKNGNEVFHTINVNESTDQYGLYDYNSKNVLEIKFTGKAGVSGKEWCTGTSGNGKCYNQSIQLKDTDLCDASNGDCTVVLYVNWRANAVITCENKTYNGKEQTIASCSGGTVAGNKKTKVGSYDITCTGDANHNNAESKKCSINKASAVITCANKTYNGKEQTIASCNGGTIAGNKKTNVGSYDITCTGDANHNNATSTKCSITKKAATATVTCNDVTYNGKTQTIGKCSKGSTAVNNSNKAKNAGNHTVQCHTDNNHEDATKTCKIKKKKTVVTCKDITYNGSKQTIASCSKGSTISNEKHKWAADYKVKCTGNDNHTTEEKTCTIKQKCTAYYSCDSCECNDWGWNLVNSKAQRGPTSDSCSDYENGGSVRGCRVASETAGGKWYCYCNEYTRYCSSRGSCPECGCKSYTGKKH